MHFPKYWTLARQKHLSAWGWSDETRAQAKNYARGDKAHAGIVV